MRRVVILPFSTDANTGDFFGKVFALTGTNLCLPGCFRLGVSASASTPNQVFPVDLATNTYYQVVVEYDATLAGLDATLWVNPIGAGDTSVITGDTVTASLQGKTLQAFAFRQGATFGNFFCSITNLATATTFSEAATAVWPTTPVAPTVVYQPQGISSFVGVSNALSLVANGQSVASLTYQWRTNGVNIANPLGNTNFFSFPSPQTTDSATYDCVVSNPNSGLSVTSSPAVVSFTVNPVPPTITMNPSNTTVYVDQTATLTVAATGAGPITYQWNYNGGPIINATSASLSIPLVESANGTTGGYECDVINQYGTSHSKTGIVSVITAPVTNIGYLRTLVDGTFFLPTNTTAYWTTTGTVISRTNMTTDANDECFIEDGTGGISVFVGGGQTFRPNIGDSVTVTGPLGQFDSLLEFELSATDPSTKFVINGSGNPLPAGPVLPLNFTNSVAYGGISNAIRLYQGMRVTFTNVYFPAADGVATFAGNSSYTMSNANGATLTLFVYSGFTNLIGTVIPPFCYTISGPMSFFLTATAADRSSGFQFEPSDPALDFITTPSSPVTVSESYANGTNVLSWTAVPYNYSYTVLASSSVSGPYTPLTAGIVRPPVSAVNAPNLPVASGLIFPTSAASVTDTNATGAKKFYRVVSP